MSAKIEQNREWKLTFNVFVKKFQLIALYIIIHVIAFSVDEDVRLPKIITQLFIDGMYFSKIIYSSHVRVCRILKIYKDLMTICRFKEEKIIFFQKSSERWMILSQGKCLCDCSSTSVLSGICGCNIVNSSKVDVDWIAQKLKFSCMSLPVLFDE